jgi:hypothetical protein
MHASRILACAHAAHERRVLFAALVEQGKRADETAPQFPFIPRAGGVCREVMDMVKSPPCVILLPTERTNPTYGSESARPRCKVPGQSLASPTKAHMVLAAAAAATFPACAQACRRPRPPPGCGALDARQRVVPPHAGRLDG